MYSRYKINRTFRSRRQTKVNMMYAAVYVMAYTRSWSPHHSGQSSSSSAVGATGKTKKSSSKKSKSHHDPSSSSSSKKSKLKKQQANKQPVAVKTYTDMPIF